MKELSKADIGLLLTSNYEKVSKFVETNNLDGYDAVVEGHRLRIFVFSESINIKYDNEASALERRYFIDGTSSVTYSRKRR